MAQLNEGRVDILSRASGELISQSQGGLTHDVILAEPSVVRVNGTRAMVTGFERHGNDLVVHMRDGSAVRYRQFFFNNPDGEHSELVFDDGVNPQQHALFPATSEATDATTAMTLTPTYESLGDLEPLLLADADYTTGVMTASGIGVLGLIGTAVGINSGGGGGGGNDNNAVTPETPVTPVTPTIAINTFAGDNILDNAEKLGDEQISGSTANVEAGQIVTITLNGQAYQATVAADGSWSVSVPSGALQAIAEGAANISVTVTNSAGTEASATLDISVTAPEVGQPTIGIETFAGDDLLDNTEKQSVQTLSGVTTNVEAGQTVTVTLNGQTFTGTVGAGGNWSVAIPVTTLAALAAGEATFTATVSNAAGVSSTATHDFLVAAAAQPGDPVITIDTFAGDDLLDNDEKQLDQMLSGTTSNVEAGQMVTITFNNQTPVLNSVASGSSLARIRVLAVAVEEQTFTAMVGEDGTWSIMIPSATLTAFDSGTATINATVANATGSTTSAAHIFIVVPPPVSVEPIAINQPLSDDGYLNASEASNGLTVSGTTTGVTAGSTVSVSLNGVNYTGVVNADGTWSVDIPSAAFTGLADGTQTLVATVVDATGTTVTSQADIDLLITNQPQVELDKSAFSDGTLNAVESSNDQVLQGVAGPGQSVVVTIGGQDYAATVAPDGSWSLTIPVEVLQALPAGANSITVTASDVAGNPPASETINFNVATTPPVFAVDPVAVDGVINATEQGAPLDITGTAPVGATVTVTLNEQTYSSGPVGADGNWTITIPADALGNLNSGSSYDLTTLVTSVEGNTASQTVPVSVDTTPPLLTVGPVAGDGTINASELQQPLNVSGTGTAGDTISVTLNGLSYSTLVDADGLWSVQIPATDLAVLNNASYDLAVTTTNPVGNISSETVPVIVSAITPVLTLDTVGGDGTINATEQTQPVVVSGSGNEGDTIAVSINGETYTTQVGAGGLWNLSIPASDLAQVPQGTQTLTVTATDPQGNVATSNTDLTFDSAPPSATFDLPGGDGYINANEVTQPLQLTGTATEGDTVTVVLGGETYTAIVPVGGNWTVQVPAGDIAQLPQGVNSVVITVTNPVGNSVIDDTQVTIETDPALLPILTIDAFTGDNVINGAEQLSDQLLSGSTTNVQPGGTVNITFNGANYTATVQPSGLWSVTIPAAALGAITADGTVTATVINVAGNSANASVDYTLDTSVTTLSIDTIAGDNYVNIIEGQAPVIISGATTNLAEGAPVTVTLNGIDYNTTVNVNGGWAVEISVANVAALPQGIQTVTVTAGEAGNSATNATILNIATAPLAEPTIDTPFGGDGILNGDELTQTQTLTGNTGLTGPGQGITVNIGGVDYPATVEANGNWSLQLPPSVLETLPEGDNALTVTLTDAAGNTSTLTNTVTVDTIGPLLAIAPIGGDDQINASEAGNELVLGGTTDAGSVLSLTINSVTYQPVVASNGTWSLNLPAGALNGLEDGKYDLTVTATDPGGNVSTASRPFILDTIAPTFSLNTPAGDGTINATEQGQPLTLSGNGSEGDNVSVTLNGITYSGVIESNGQWNIEVPVGDVAALGAGNNLLAVTVRDAAGNTASQTSNLVVDTTLPLLTVDAISGDGRLNSVEITQPLVLSGSGQSGDDVSVVMNNKLYFTRVGVNGRWSLEVAPSDLAALADGNTALTFTATNPLGNQSSVTGNLLVDAAPANQPGISVAIDLFAGDGIVDAAEQREPQLLRGTTTNVEAGQTVTAVLNGESYSGIVEPDGSWSLEVPAAAFIGIASGDQTFTISVNDIAGNTATTNATFIIDPTASGVALAPISGDNYLNAVELGEAVVISGVTSNIAPDSIISVSVNNVTYQTTVNADGSWSTTVPAGALSGLSDGPLTVTASVVDNNNITLTNSATVNVLATNLPVANLDPAFGDGALNAADITTTGTLTGTTGVAGVGQSVSVVLDGTPYNGTVDANGNWSVSIPATELSALSQGNLPYSVTVTDIAGNSANGAGSVLVDTAAPDLVLTTIPGGDGVLNAAELTQPLALSGTSEADSTIVATLNGTPYSVVTNAQGNWALEIPANALTDLADGNYDLSITATDAAGNATAQTSILTVKATPLTITINDFASDNIVNGAELQTEQLLSGTTTNVEQGQTVTITLNSQIYSAEVEASGYWSVLVPAAALQAINGATATIGVAVTDIAGNTASAELPITIDAGSAGLSFNIISDDNYLNATEAGQELLLSGSSFSLAVDTPLTITFNNQAFNTTVGANGNWTAVIPVSALAGLQDGEALLTISGVDLAGNQVVGNSILNVLVNNLPAIGITSAFGDGVLNAVEVDAAQTISGTTNVDGDGQTVALTLNNIVYQGTVDGNGNWLVTVPATALAALTEGNNAYSVTVTDEAGNASTTTGNVLLDLTPPTLTLGVVTGDNAINATEAAGIITLTGGSDAEAGQPVILTLNGQTYNTAVDGNGNWTFDLPAGSLAGIAEGTYTLTATVTDAAGNATTLTRDIDVAANPLVTTIDQPFIDDYVGISEAAATQTITGSTGATGAGQTVVVTLNGVDYDAAVDNDGRWTLDFDAATLQGLPEGSNTLLITATDSVGNIGTTSNSFTVDLTAPSLTIDTITGDNYINVVEVSQDFPISGTASLEDVGQVVTVTLNNQTFTSQVLNDGSWSVVIPASVLQGAVDGDYTVTATLADTARNVTTTTSILVREGDLQDLPTLTIDVISGDGYINAAEAGQNLTLSGSSTNLEEGRQVSISFGGQTYLATVEANGNWSTQVPSADLARLADGVQTVTVDAITVAGNAGSAIADVTLVAGANSQPTLSVNVVAGDDTINAQEAANPVVIGGSSQLLAEGTIVTVNLNNIAYAGAVDVDGNWSVTVPAADIQALPQGGTAFTTTAEGVGGNIASIDHDITVNTTPPALLAADLDIGTSLNLAEALAGLVVNGTSDANLPISITLNGKVYTTASNNNGDWTLTVPSADLLLLADGPQQLVVSAIDIDGNISTQALDFTAAINALPGLSIDQPFGDGLLNNAESGVEQLISGVAIGLEVGTPVTVTIGTLTFTGAVEANNRWSITLAPNALDTLADGGVQITVTAIDAAGNPATGSLGVELLVDSLPNITLNTPFTDGLLNAAEASVTQTLTGTTGMSGAGQTVTVLFDGISLPVTVDANGNWSATVTPAQMASVGDSTFDITVTANDRAGNQGENSVPVTAIIINTPDATVATPFTDGYLNVAEAAQGGQLTGTTSITGQQTVTVNINGSLYTANVDQAAGTWSLDLPAALLQTLPDGNWPLTVTVTDSVGNVSTASSSLQVLINNLPDATINLPFGNGALDALEAQSPQTISGSTGITGAGQAVSVAISGFNNDDPLIANIDASGNWNLPLSTTQLATLANGSHTITVTATDAAGNSDIVTQDVITGVTTVLPTVTGDVVFGDNQLNIVEAANGVTVTGSTNNTGANQAVQLTVNLNGTPYIGTVDNDGNWAVAIPAGALSSLTNNATYTLDVVATDAAGNTVTQSFDFTTALVAPVPTVDAAFSNGYLNATAIADGFTLTGTTGSAGAGQSVVVTLAGVNYPDATVDANGNWRLPLTSDQLTGLNDGTYNFSVQATDGAGNVGSTSDTLVVDLSIPVVTIDPFTGDNALDYAESIVSQTLTGTTAGAEPGSTVNVILGDLILTTQVGANNTWSVQIPAQQLQALQSPTTVSVTVTDPAGNVSTTVTETFTVDITPPEGVPLVTLNVIAGDNIFNASETGDSLLSGTYSNLIEGSDVTLTVGGTAYIATLDGNGGWTVLIPESAFAADGLVQVVVSTPDGEGGTVTSSETVLVDRLPPALTISAFATDDIVNSGESNSSQIISGTASTSEVGRTVAVSLNGQNYNAIVQENGTWAVTVPAASMQALAEGSQTITAQLSDAAGNVGTDTHNFTVDITAPLILVDAFLGNNLINAADILLNQVLTGTATGAEGQTITLYAGDTSPIATAVVQPDGTFSLALTPEVLGSLNDGALVLGLQVGDQAGNLTDATITVNKVVNSALTLVVDSVFGDGALNALDVTVAQAITGTVSSAGVGAIVSTVIAGQTLTAAVAQDGRFSITVPQGLLSTIPDGTLAFDVTVSDVAGNTRTVTEAVPTIITGVPVIGSLSGLLTADNLLNIAEAAAGQTIGGVVQAAEGSQIRVTLGTHAYTTTVNADGVWSLQLPAADLTSLLDGTLSLGVRVVDPVGNVAQDSVNVGIFTQTPTISITSMFGDNVLNLADIASGQLISGVVTNAAAGSVVTINIGDSQITTTVGSNGVFTATVTPEILSTLAQGDLTASASVIDVAGNAATSPTVGFRVDTVLPAITVNPLFGDGLLNVADALLTQTISGVVADAGAGSRVVVSVAGQQLVTTTAADGSFSVSLSPAILQGLADGTLTVGVSVTDTAGNTNSTTADALVGIHTPPSITLAPLFGDGVLNLAESLVTQTISGTVANVAPNTQVLVSIGNTVLTTTTDSTGLFSAQVSPTLLATLLNGNLTVGVSVTDVVGNTSATSVGVQLGISNQPTLTLNTVFGDGVLSAVDLASNQIISGGSTNLTTGSTVSVTLNGRSYTTQVGSNGTWALSVPKADLAAIADGTQTVSISAADAYGNIATSSGSVSVISHTEPTITLNPLFSDNALNATEVRTAQTISGTTTNAEGSTITVQVGTTNYTGTVNSAGGWSITIPAASLAAIADGSYTVLASVTNLAGSTGSSSAPLIVVSHTTPTVVLNSYFGGDGYLNIAEANTIETISGTSTNAVGGTVTVNVAGIVYTTTVGSGGAWSINLPSETLKTINDGSYTVAVTVTDIGGNTAATSRAFTALSHNAPQIGVDPVLNVVTSLLVGLSVNGGTANAAQGSTVRLTLLLANGAAGPSVTTTTDALGRYTGYFSPQLLSVSGLLLSLTTGVQAQVIDVAGNSTAIATTLLLGSLLAVNASVSTASLMQVDDTSSTASSVESTNSTSSEESTTLAHSAKLAAVSTLVTEADDLTTSTASATSTTASSTESSDVVATVVTDEHSYTIGGVVITLADGSSIEGPSVTGSSGNDTVTVNDLNFTHIDGGAGVDTLVLNGDHMSLDLTTLGLKIENIEVLDLGKSGTNAVKLNLNDALNITDTQKDDLVIKGDNGGQVTLANTEGGVWATTGQRTVDSHVFDIYHNSALTGDNTLGDVLVQHNLQVNVA